jgi:hypothetical protein
MHPLFSILSRLTLCCARSIGTLYCTSSEQAWIWPWLDSPEVQESATSLPATPSNLRRAGPAIGSFTPKGPGPGERNNFEEFAWAAIGLTHLSIWEVHRLVITTPVVSLHPTPGRASHLARGLSSRRSHWPTSCNCGVQGKWCRGWCGLAG